MLSGLLGPDRCDAVGEELLDDEQLVGVADGVRRARIAALHRRVLVLHLDFTNAFGGECQPAYLHDVHDAVGKATACGLLEDELGGPCLHGGRADGGPDGGSDGANGGSPRSRLPGRPGEEAPEAGAIMGSNAELGHFEPAS